MSIFSIDPLTGRIIPTDQLAIDAILNDAIVEGHRGDRRTNCIVVKDKAIPHLEREKKQKK